MKTLFNNELSESSQTMHLCYMNRRMNIMTTRTTIEMTSTPCTMSWYFPLSRASKHHQPTRSIK